jgi:general stress protein CsbA
MFITKLNKYYIKFQIYLSKHLEILKKEYFSQFFLVILFNVVLIVGQFVYLALRYKYLNASVPFWYSMPWGDYQLDYRRNLFLIPIISTAIFITGMLMTVFMRRFLIRYLSQVLTATVTFSNIALTYSLFRIIRIASIPYPSAINPLYLQLALPFVAGFVLVFFLAPKFIEFARKRGIVTNPNLHDHPGMVLTKPSARGGGAVFVLGFIIVSLLFVPFSKELLGI